MLITPPIAIPKSLRVTDEQFLAFVQANPDLRLERTATGELVVMALTGSESGFYNAELTGECVLWNRQRRAGKIFDSSTGFRLPNGAIRTPDVAWVAQARWDALLPEEQQGFAPLCPDFVIELRSQTDIRSEVEMKMQEYIDNGCRLGWLIDPQTQTVSIYRPGQAVVAQSWTTPLSGERVLPGLVVNLEYLFGDRITT